ncbi:hypothetical protein [Crateriforma conspicua]|uniref:hypothetical protein n=1 Tax=Crateriforma conspicua TaxID=2527996 RepID=UPI001187E079|nr:hypothetical protein [Crateriforma conspicua]QDV60980.1 hypothetical protein Mal65_01010 [Crateriforma conspicua]
MSDKPLKWFLQAVGGVSLFAFGAAVMPAHWITQISVFLGFDPFPDSPLTFYLARHLSLMYGFVGAVLLVVASDLTRYRPLIALAAAGTVLLGVLQLVIDWLAGLPSWWTWGESMSTVVGGLCLKWLDRNCGSVADKKR